jgi:hypothetical protein
MHPDQDLTVIRCGLRDLPDLDDVRGTISLGNGCSHQLLLAAPTAPVVTGCTRATSFEDRETGVFGQGPYVTSPASRIDVAARFTAPVPLRFGSRSASPTTRLDEVRGNSR